MDYLVFRLYGPMASWGEIAVGESRHSAGYPSRSALLGLLAAALGVRRGDDRAQERLAVGYRFAVKVFSQGSLLRDYHTAQVPDAVGKFRYRSRRDEVVKGRKRLGTILSTREYRADAFAVVAVEALAEAPYPLEVLKEALLKPKFHLYLGRKSCPLSAPLNSVVSSGGDLRRVLDEYPCGALLPGGASAPQPLTPKEARLLWLDREPPRYYWEGEPNLMKGSVQTILRHDQPLSRRRWQFKPREEHCLVAHREKTSREEQ